LKPLVLIINFKLLFFYSFLPSGWLDSKSKIFCFWLSACGISLNHPASCGSCRSQNAAALKAHQKKMSKGAVPLSSIFKKIKRQRRVFGNKIGLHVI